MPPQNQPSSLTPDDHAANLALATHISTQLATPQQAPEAPQAPTGAPEDVTQIDLAPQIESLQKQVDALTKQVAQQPQQELAQMRQMIEQALGEEDANENGK